MHFLSSGVFHHSEIHKSDIQHQIPSTLRPIVANTLGILDELLARCAAHDRIVHQHHDTVLNDATDCVEFAPNFQLAFLLARCNESATNVVVSNDAFVTGATENVRATGVELLAYSRGRLPIS